jgi:hypothetical protein
MTQLPGIFDSVTPQFDAAVSSIPSINSFENDLNNSLPAAVSKYRNQCRSDEIGADYNGMKHFLVNNTVAISAIIMGLIVAGSGVFSSTALVTFLSTFLFSNYIEYAAHRYKMHPMKVHTRHSGLHHRFFTHKAMFFDSLQDAKMILFPERAYFIVATRGLSIITVILCLIFNRTVGGVFLATGSFYYLNYEW